MITATPHDHTSLPNTASIAGTHSGHKGQPRAELPLHLHVEVGSVVQSFQHQGDLFGPDVLLPLVLDPQDHTYQLRVASADSFIQNCRINISIVRH